MTASRSCSIKVETVYAYDRSKLLTVSQDDIFMATTWWTAHIAHEAANTLNKSKFIYLVRNTNPSLFQWEPSLRWLTKLMTFRITQSFRPSYYAITSVRTDSVFFSETVSAGEESSISFQIASLLSAVSPG